MGVKKLARLEVLKEPGVFEFGGFLFKPERQFRKGEVDKHLGGDSRPWKRDAQYAMRNMHSSGIGKENYSHAAFYAASGNSDADIFRCVETGKLFVPCASELCFYDEPPQREKAARKPEPPQSKEPSTLLGELDDAKAESAARDAAPKDKPQTKKRGDTEVTD
jgi:hypothetical protein